MKHQRLYYAAASAALVLSEIAIALFAHGFVRGSVGDILVVVLLFCIIRTFFPEKHALLPAYVFLFACCAELLQLTGFLAWTGLDRYEIAAVALGGTFSAGDIICYAVGALICFLIQKYMLKND